MPTRDTCQLLESVRVLDLAAGGADIVTRLLADLGADVLKVEPPGGAPDRTALPRLGDTGIGFALHNANKRSAVLDPGSAADRHRLIDLAGEADIVVDSGRAAGYGTSAEELGAHFPHLVALTITDFGTAGPRASWQATDAVLYALSSALSRSGPATGTPVLPPDGIATATAAVQATWAALVAYYHRLRCGRGDVIDFSRLEAVVMALDPPFGSHGQAAAGLRRGERWRGRPRNQDAYPIIACRDGYVRLVVMSPRQWRGLRAWMGEPQQFQDPKFDVIAERFAVWDQIGALLAQQFAEQTMADLVATGQSHGVPIAEVLDPADALTLEHFLAVGASTTAELAPGMTATVPVGYHTVDGAHAGFRRPAPAPGADEPRWLDTPRRTPGHDARASERGLPFEGLRIIDLGIIVAGGELGRLFADLGAEVIKVESAAYPDGLRQARAGDLMSESFAWTHRNKLGLGLELRSADGAGVLTRLVADADAVFANFKPGTLAALGFSYDRLCEIKPDIVLAESSAYGDTGPWSARMGYGPLVRAGTGVTRLWTGPTGPDGQSETASATRHRFFDATTVFPDHVVGRISAIGALAALIHRDRTGSGARLHVSQAEASVSQLDTVFVTETLRGSDALQPDTATHSVAPCAGDDEWCVVSLRDDADRAALDALLGDTALEAWTARRSPVEAAEALQAIGIAAAPMLRRMELLEDPQLVSRSMFQPMHHPLFDVPMPSETGPAPFRGIPNVPTRPAPLPGQHTREICQKILGFDESTTQRLIDDGVLFSTDPPATDPTATDPPEEASR